MYGTWVDDQTVPVALPLRDRGGGSIGTACDMSAT